MKILWAAPLALALLNTGAAQEAAGTPSSLVQPAVDLVAKAGSSVDLNKWKGSSAARTEVDGNLESIQRDLADTLPPLLSASNAAPRSIAATLPVLLNLDALYSVLLRVSISARTSAPRDQAEQVDGALAALDGARRDLGGYILAAAAGQERRIADLQAQGKAQADALAALQRQATQAAAKKPAGKKPAKKR